MFSQIKDMVSVPKKSLENTFETPCKKVQNRDFWVQYQLRKKLKKPHGVRNDQSFSSKNAHKRFFSFPADA